MTKFDIVVSVMLHWLTSCFIG